MRNEWKNAADETKYVKRTQENRLGKKPMSKGRYALTILAYLLVVVLVIALGTSLYVWIDESITKNTTAMLTNADMAAQFNVGVLYSQEDMDAQLEVARQEVAEELEQALAERTQALAERDQALVEKDQAAAAREEEILGSLRASLEEGNTMVESLRPLYPNEIVLVSDGAFHFVPIRDDLTHNSYLQEQLEILESGEYQYLEDGQVISHKGIDVSEHQGVIDWTQVAGDGVEFAFIRANYRGYGTGKLVEDKNFAQNVSGATAAGVKVGVYVFTQAITADEVQEEADLVLSQIAPYTIECPIVIDIEKTGDSSGRMNQLSLEERTALVLQFCQIIENAGYQVMIYHNTEMGALMLDLEPFEGYDKWFASYSDQMFYPYAYKVWQYSSTGSVNGIKGNVDLNISFSDFWNE
ncbi:MAG: hypothetical protein NC417_13190 [Candidatus Gastranaerophilales bacterium]|nr:hypothetical protein [Candidatus Gastranaerophilales bacterium]